MIFLHCNSWSSKLLAYSILLRLQCLSPELNLECMYKSASRNIWFITMEGADLWTICFLFNWTGHVHKQSVFAVENMRCIGSFCSSTVSTAMKLFCLLFMEIYTAHFSLITVLFCSYTLQCCSHLLHFTLIPTTPWDRSVSEYVMSPRSPVSFHGRVGIQIWVSQILAWYSNHWNAQRTLCPGIRLTQTCSHFHCSYTEGLEFAQLVHIPNDLIYYECMYILCACFI